MSKSRIAFALVAAFAVSCGSGPAGPAGPAGPTGPAGPGFTAGPSISAVSPTFVAVGTTTLVSLSGFATEWTSAATVSFGAGTHTSKVVAASGTALLVTLQVDATATPGTRDVTVSEGGATQSYKGAFQVLPTVGGTLLGQPAPGGLGVFHLQSNDPSVQLSSFPTINLTPAGLVSTSTLRSSAVAADLLVTVDVVLADGGTPAGSVDLQYVNTSGAVDLTFDFPGAIAIGAPSFTAMTPGTPVNGTLTNPYQADTYQLDFPDGGPQYDVVVTSTNDTQVTLLPPSGRWSSKVFQGPAGGLSPGTPGSYYLTVWNPSGATGQYTLDVNPVPSEVEPNDDPTTATPLTAGSGIAGQFASLTDLDYFKVTATAADVGKSFHVVTSPGDSLCDTVVDALDSAGVSLGGPSDDASFHEDFTSAPIPAAGDYAIEVYESSYVSSYDPTRSHYLLRVTIE